jgi:hypothetical protein
MASCPKPKEGCLTDIWPICQPLIQGHDKIQLDKAHRFSEPAPLAARHSEHRQRDIRRNRQSFGSRGSSRASGVSEPFQPRFAEHARTAIPGPALKCRSHKESFRSSRPEKKCARGLIGKLPNLLIQQSPDHPQSLQSATSLLLWRDFLFETGDAAWCSRRMIRATAPLGSPRVLFNY